MVAHPAARQDEEPTPHHVAVIMDGNGRWAKQRALPRAAGHQAGIRPVRRTVEYCAERGVGVLTLFAFSSENWRRPPDEVSGLMALFLDALDREVAELDGNGIRLKFIGDRAKLSRSLSNATYAAEARTRDNSVMELVVAVAYGGRWDLTEAARGLAREAAAGRLDPEEIDEARIKGALATAGTPGVDLLIRTGGEKRISNFLLWDAAYAELYFSDALWPEMTTAELDRAFAFYTHRQRRFGRTSDQIEAASC